MPSDDQIRARSASSGRVTAESGKCTAGRDTRDFADRARCLGGDHLTPSTRSLTFGSRALTVGRSAGRVGREEESSLNRQLAPSSIDGA